MGKNRRYRTADGRAQIEWELVWKPDPGALEWELAWKPNPGAWVFTASGQFDGRCGQCLDSIAEAYPDDDKVSRIYTVWKQYHLNDRRPGCEHQSQDAEYCNPKLLTVGVEGFDIDHHAAYNGYIKHLRYRPSKTRRRFYTERERTDYAQKEIWELQRKLDAASRNPAKLPQKLRLNLGRNSGMDALLAYLDIPEGLREYIDVRYKKTIATHVHWQEHPYGLLTRPCGVCGYEYGSAWNLLPIPEDVVREIQSWDEWEAPEDDLRDHLAKEFLSRHEIDWTISKPVHRPAEWEPHGWCYNITLYRAGDSYSFPYWGSAHDKTHGIPATVGDVLSACTEDLSLDVESDSFEAFCGAIGEGSIDDISHKKYLELQSQYEELREHARRLREVLGGEVVTELMESGL